MTSFKLVSKKKQCRRAYACAVFIDFVQRHPGMAVTNYPDSFETELDIVNTVTFARSLARRKLLHHNKSGGYDVTEEGRKLIDLDYVAFYQFCSPYVDIYDFEQERQAHGEESFCAAMWSVLLRELRRRMKEGDFTAVGNLHRDIALLYEREQCAEQAAYHFAAALYVHYSGLQYYDDLLKLIRGTKSEKTVRALGGFIYAPPLITDGIRRSRDLMTRELVDRVYRSIPLSVNLLSPEMFYDLVQDFCTGKYNDEQWQDRIAEAFGRLLEHAKALRASRRVKSVPAPPRKAPKKALPKASEKAAPKRLPKTPR